MHTSSGMFDTAVQLAQCRMVIVKRDRKNGSSKLGKAKRA